MLSDSNARIVAARRLTTRRGRREAGRFLAEGAQAVREAVSRPAVVHELFATEATAAAHAELLDQLPNVSLISERAAASLSETVTPQGLVAVCDRIDVALQELPAHPQLVAICVEPNDPGNLGTIVRTADAAGADAVIVVGTSVDLYNGKSVRASAGSLFHLPIVLGAQWATVRQWLCATALRSVATTGGAAVSLPELDTSVALAWLFGSEAHGLPDEVLAEADVQVRIPLYGAAESLNLAAAAAVCLYTSAFAQRAASSS